MLQEGQTYRHFDIMTTYALWAAAVKIKELIIYGNTLVNLKIMGGRMHFLSRCSKQVLI